MMLGSQCSPCCDDCKGCKSAAWGAAKRFAQSLASLNGTSYSGLSINGQVQDSVFAVQSSAAVATFEGSSVFPPVPGLGNGKNRAQAFLRSDSEGCVSGRARVNIPLDEQFFGGQEWGNAYSLPPFEVRVEFNDFSSNNSSASPLIVISQSVTGFQFFQPFTSRPLITSVRFGGQSVSGTPWDGVSEPTTNNGILGNLLYIFPSNNCKFRGIAIDERQVLQVPVGSYGGPIEIDLTVFGLQSNIDAVGDVFATYFVLGSGTITVQWDDMTEFEVDENDEDCGSCFCDSNNEPSGCPGRIDYLYGPVYSNVPQNQEIPASVQTITVPPEFSLPVLVRMCGGGDDGIAINGVRVTTFGQRIPASAFLVLESTRTFTIGTWNNRGSAVGSAAICFFELNPLP